MNITILGCGFGTALSVLWDKAGHKVTAWTKYEEEVADIIKCGEHKKLLPGVPVPKTISFTTDINAVKGADIVVFAIPSRFVREVAEKVGKVIESGTIILNVGKGFEDGTHKRLSQVISEEIPNNPVVVMAGPCHAEEVGRCVPTTVVVASENKKAAERIQNELQTETFRIYLNDDVAGCEIAAAIKNPIALSCGIVEGMKLGDNTLASLMTRGLAEMARLGVAMGAKWETFTGLAGVGDMIVTCTSVHSRNHRAGILIGQGMKAADAVREVGTVEGYGCCAIAYEIANQLGVSVPIIDNLYRVCYGDETPQQALKKLMDRPQKHEREEYWNCG